MRRPSAALARFAALALVTAACSNAPARPAADSAAAPASAAATPAPADTTWTALFDGTPASIAAHWRGYKTDTPPASWKVEDGALAFVPGASADMSGGDLVSRDEYGDFELALEWRIARGGNSGVIYRAGLTRPNVWETGAEMQVLDNQRHADGRDPLTSAGADYALYPPARDVTRPVGEWNAARLVARGPHVEHWLNGVKVVEYEQGSPDWQAKVKASKFAAMPDYGRAMRGHLALQDHGNRVWYRNVRVRALGGAADGAASASR